MQMLKKALIAYVNSIKAIWSAMAHPLSIVSKRKGTLQDYRIYGNSVQEGEPTPDNPIEVQSVGELTTKNLFDKSTVTKGAYIDDADGKVGTGEYYASDYIEVTPNTAYYFTIQTSGNRGAWYDENKTYISGILGYASKTSPSNARYCRITVTSPYLDKMQVEEGTTATDYEPYHKYKVPVTVRGKNLFNLSKMFSTAVTLNGLTIEPYGYNGIRVYGTPTTESTTLFRIDKWYTYFIKSGTTLKPSTKLDTLYGNITGGCSYSFQVGCYDPTVAWIVNANSGNSSAITLSRDMATFRTLNVSIRPSDTETYLDFVFYPMIEVGSKTTPYEPYIEPQVHNLYLNEPLRKIGDYADCIDGEKSVVVRKCCKRYLKDYNNWGNIDASLESRYGFCVKDHSIVPSSVNYTGRYKVIGKSDMFPVIADENSSKFLFLCISTSFYNVRVYLPSEYLTDDTIASFTEWLAEYNPYMLRVLATPTEEPIELPKLPQFKGTTIYEVQADITPSGIEAQYYE